MKRGIILIAVLAVAMLYATGCTTISTGLADTGNGKPTGTMAKGSATAVYLFGIFPLTEGSDAQAAYSQALSTSGATGLRGATMQSTIMQLFIIQLEIIKVQGQVVK